MSTNYRAPAAWGLTWLAYATYYTGRKGFSVVKKTLETELGLSTIVMGRIDTLYLAAYAGGQFVSGWLGDGIGARRLIGWGMLASAACCVGFGSVSGAILFALFFTLNGLAQSSGWPGTTRSVAEWTTRQNRGRVMAFWATCYMVGGLVANAFAGEMAHRFGWRAAFWGPAAAITAVALLVLLTLPARTAADAVGAVPEKEVRALRARRRAAQREVVRNPLLWYYGGSYFFIKFIRYTLLFWLPYYLADTLKYSVRDAAYLSNAFEAGGIIGVVALGISSDRIKRYSRSLLAAPSLAGLALALFAYKGIESGDTTYNAVLLGLIGASLFGPDALISGAAAQDAGGPDAAAMATGFVNGLGSIGAMAQGLLVPQIAETFGWQAVFPLFTGCALLAGAMLIPTFKLGAPKALPV